ncbi:hypothetical protein Moror_15512 [Moniliophthora roreri MCA 2997]|uniref:Uncharacterized protein n=2 Tax=Moniliophthora roreri TaxID=221103 RepID=V2XMD2_MONRO|nr:hypothetical protein Moror_15512 [Moniliophthora roreri MCA 2997]
MKLQEHYCLITKDKPGQHFLKVTALHAQIKELKEANVTLTANAGSAAINKQCKGPHNSDLKCLNAKCGKVRHLIEDCFEEGGGKQGQYPDWWKGKKWAALPSANTLCTRCSFNMVF